jgi:CMP-N,N'-diacetyllegionaminic acid synthase
MGRVDPELKLEIFYKGLILINNNYYIGVIPARKGSKGLPNKNILKINGRTLLEISVREALDVELLNEIVVTTDYDIEDTGLSSYLENSRFSLISRSVNNSEDSSPVESSILEMHKSLARGQVGKEIHIVLLQPTSPLRKSFHIDNAIKKYITSGCQKLASFTQLNDCHPARMYRIESGSAQSYLKNDVNVSSHRQKLEKLYIRNGAMYICSLRALISGESFTDSCLNSYIMGEAESINIDSEVDYLQAKYIAENEYSPIRA